METANCWVCIEFGNYTLYPIGELINLTQGKYRCHGHEDEEIFEAGRRYQEKKEGK